MKSDRGFIMQTLTVNIQVHTTKQSSQYIT